MGFGVCLNISRTPTKYACIGTRKLVGKQVANGSDKEPKVPAAHLVA